MLEGNEVDKKYDNGAGEVIIDVDAKGGVLLSNSYKKDLDGFAEVESVTKLKSNILTIAEKIAAKTKTQWDDKAVASLKSLLGIVDAVSPN